MDNDFRRSVLMWLIPAYFTNQFSAISYNKKPFYIIFKKPPKRKKNLKQKKGVTAERYQQEDRVEIKFSL